MTGKQFYRARVVGTGHYVPDRLVTNDDLAKFVDTNDEWIQTRTGIKTRRLVEEGQMGTSEMAEFAARRALEDAGLTTDDLDMIILGTVTPDHQVPAASCELQNRLGVKKNIPSFDLSAACASCGIAQTDFAMEHDRQSRQSEAARAVMWADCLRELVGESYQ